MLPVLRFFGRKLHLRKYFEALKNIQTYLFILEREENCEQFAKKKHPNSTNGSGDIVFQSQKIIKIL